jgi:hypothetical protein
MTDILLNIATRFSQDDPAVAALPGGRFVAVWTDSDSDPGSDGFDGIVGGIFDTTGRAVAPQFRVNQEPSGYQFAPVVTATATGFTVGLGSTGPDAQGRTDAYVDLWMRSFDAAGRPLTDERMIAGGGTRDHRPEDIVTLSDGSLLLLSASSMLRTDFDIVAHRFDADGARLGAPRLLRAETDTGIGGTIFSTPEARATPLTGGDYLLTWWERLTDGVPGQDPKFDSAVFARRFAADGTPEGPARTVTPLRRGELSVDREGAEAARIGAGAVAVAWTREVWGVRRESDRDVEFRLIAEDGTPLTPIVQVNERTVGDQVLHDVLHLGQGYSLVTYANYIPGLGEVYQDFFGLDGRVYGPDGAPVGASFLISQFAYEDLGGASATRLTDGRIAFVWHGGRPAAEDVVGRILGDGLGGVRLGGPGADALTGDGGPDLVLAGAGDDRVEGLGGDDVIFGEAGDDRLFGGAGDDLLAGGDGDDSLRGGDGADELRGGAGDDVLRGEAGDDVLRGGAGSDILAGGPGRDVMFGGSGADRFILEDGHFGATRASADVIADMGPGDVIDLTRIDARPGTAADDAFVWIGTNPFGGRAGELREARPGEFVADLDGDRRVEFVLLAAGAEREDFLL